MLKWVDKYDPHIGWIGLHYVTKTNCSLYYPDCGLPGWLW